MKDRISIEWTDRHGRLHMKVLSPSSAASFCNFLVRDGATGILLCP